MPADSNQLSSTANRQMVLLMPSARGSEFHFKKAEVLCSKNGFSPSKIVTLFLFFKIDT